MDRRTFMEAMALSAVSLGLSNVVSCANFKPKLDVLVLGGTYFLGPAIVNAFRNAGHAVTLFNRGLTNPDLFPDLPHIFGDRENGPEAYLALQHKQWDLVIDVWPQRSVLVDESTAALQSYAKHYSFISSVAVYKNFNEAGRSEDDSVLDLPKDKSTWGYSEEKAASEKLVSDRFPNNHTILRPGPIKGWRDPAHDLLYWLLKLQRNEDILAPGNGNDPLQFIDVKDVAKFAVRAIENKLAGIYNCVGPKENVLVWKDFLNLAKTHLQSTSKLYWSDKEFLENHEVYAWEHLPLWAPISDDFFMEVSNAKAVAAGFNYSPLEKTLDDCLAWCRTKGNPDMLFGVGDEPVGITVQKEKEVIESLERRDN
ncbi:NAD-dependent epimerase/dehydratase family protein [Flagellimonas flava]|uniref:NAD-dependent epimerase/dehydratase family protein n=1 Tax=Flagellimonas flava TaxID=570519 RepID=UPI003D650934